MELRHWRRYSCPWHRHRPASLLETAPCQRHTPIYFPESLRRGLAYLQANTGLNSSLSFLLHSTITPVFSILPSLVACRPTLTATGHRESKNFTTSVSSISRYASRPYTFVFCGGSSHPVASLGSLFISPREYDIALLLYGRSCPYGLRSSAPRTEADNNGRSSRRRRFGSRQIHRSLCGPFFRRQKMLRPRNRCASSRMYKVPDLLECLTRAGFLRRLGLCREIRLTYSAMPPVRGSMPLSQGPRRRIQQGCPATGMQ